jgi:amino acid transporter
MSADLRREFSLRDLVLFHTAAIVTVRWISFSAARGPSSLTLWALSFFLFFLPIAHVVVRFTRVLPKEGGLYQWTKSSLGPFHGFLCAWSYFVSNLFYFPSLLLAVSGYAAFALRGDDQALQNNTTFALLFTLSTILIVMMLNIIGLKFGKWVENLGGLAIWIPCGILILLGLLLYLRNGTAMSFAVPNLLPDIRKFDTFTAWGNICFAFAGIELAATMGDEVKEAGSNLPRSVYIAGVVITGIYILCTLVLLLFLDPAHINLITGILQAIAKILAAAHLSFLTPVIAVLLTIGGLGTLGAWFAGAARLPFSVGVDRYLPTSLGRVHPRWHTPYVALIVQGVLACVIVMMSLSGGATVKEAYVELCNATLILFFIPYVYIFVAFLRHAEGRAPLSSILGVCGLLSTCVSIFMAAWPPSDVNAVRYLIGVVGGTLVLLAAAVALYWFAARRMARQPER